MVEAKRINYYLINILEPIYRYTMQDLVKVKLAKENLFMIEKKIDIFVLQEIIYTLMKN
jgi:hypothetical protein